MRKPSISPALARTATAAALAATPALLAASLATPSAAYASATAAQPASVTRPQARAALAPQARAALAKNNLNTGSARELAPADAKVMSTTRPSSYHNRVVHTCNYSNRTVYVAMGQYYPFSPEQRYATSGWWSIENTKCRNFWAMDLLVLDANHSHRWDISRNYIKGCVVYPGPFTVFDAWLPKVCSDAGGAIETFAAVPDGSGTLNWNLTH